jgi:hypothetical protein
VRAHRHAADARATDTGAEVVSGQPNRRELLDAAWMMLDGLDWADLQRDLREAVDAVRAGLDRMDLVNAERMAILIRGFGAVLDERASELYDVLHRARRADIYDSPTS